MIDVDEVRVVGALCSKPFRVKVDGKLLKDKKGDVKKFSTMLEALSYGQRYAERKGKG